MTDLELELLLHKNIEYDAQDGEDKYRVTMTTEWMRKADFQRLVGLSDIGVVNATFKEGKHERPSKEATNDQRQDMDP